MGEKWTKDELLQVYELWKRNKNKIHEHNEEIRKLGEKLGRRTRTVEAQMIMFRALERDGNYSRKKMSKLCKEIWYENGNYEEENTNNIEMSNERDLIEFIVSRSYGADNATVVPYKGLDLKRFQGKNPAGINDVMNHFEDAITDAGSIKLEWVFLVGGPGNGKSHQSVELINNLKIELNEEKGIGSIARRSYFDKNTSVHVINDATIRDYVGDQPNDLARDLKESITKLNDGRYFLMANINRGILIDEKHANIAVKSLHEVYNL